MGAMCGLDQVFKIMQIITITQIILVVYNILVTLHRPWDAMTDASRCNALRVSAEEGGGTSSFQRILAHSAFCVKLMYMRDPMHQIDNGIIISFLKAILRKYRECVESTMDKIGLAAKKLTLRLRLLLRKYTNVTGHR